MGPTSSCAHLSRRPALALSSAAFSLEFEFKFEFEVEVRMTTPDGPLFSDVTDVRALAAGLPGMRWEWAFARACGRYNWRFGEKGRGERVR